MEAAKQVLQGVERVARPVVTTADLRITDPNFVAERFEMQERIGTDKAVAADLFAADDALEQKCVSASLQLAKGTDRCQRVTDQTPIDRHHVRAPGEFGELIEVRVIPHRIDLSTAMPPIVEPSLAATSA